MRRQKALTSSITNSVLLSLATIFILHGSRHIRPRRKHLSLTQGQLLSEETTSGMKRDECSVHHATIPSVPNFECRTWHEWMCRTMQLRHQLRDPRRTGHHFCRCLPLSSQLAKRQTSVESRMGVYNVWHVPKNIRPLCDDASYRTRE